MLTTKDINLKENKPKKLKIISTNKTESKQFKSNKKPVENNHPTITTANMEGYRKKYENDERMAKARAAKKKSKKK